MWLMKVSPYLDFLVHMLCTYYASNLNGMSVHFGISWKIHVNTFFFGDY